MLRDNRTPTTSELKQEMRMLSNNHSPTESEYKPGSKWEVRLLLFSFRK